MTLRRLVRVLAMDQPFLPTVVTLYESSFVGTIFRLMENLLSLSLLEFDSSRRIE